ncbi:MAG: PLP-dependent aminotransferase family protein [Myxococcota bacterium]
MAEAFRYVQLADSLQARIAEGAFVAGDRLPSIRTLRRQTGYSISTVSQALEELDRRGWVQSRPRSGYFVRARPLTPPPRVSRSSLKPRPATLHALTESIVQATGRPGWVALGGAAVSPDLLPLSRLGRAARDVLSDDPGLVARYTEAAGTAGLRAEIAKRSHFGGRVLDADDVVITHGCMDAIRLCLMAVAKPGGVVAIESPTFFGFLQLLRDLDMRAVEIPCDPQTGLDIDALERTLSEHAIDALIVTPSVQNPLGARMPPAHGQRLLALARRHRFAVIEDDVYGDLAFGDARPVPLAAMDPGGAVLYCSSFSKTLAAGLRLGWAVPGAHRDRVAQLKLSSSICSPALNQAIVERFIAEGAYDRHLRKLRLSLRRQLEAVREAVVRHFPAGTRLSAPTGGFVLWVQLPRAIDGAELYAAAARHEVAVMPGAVCSMTKRYDACLRLSCGHPFTDRTEAGLATLGELVRRRLG